MPPRPLEPQKARAKVVGFLRLSCLLETLGGDNIPLLTQLLVLLCLSDLLIFNLESMFSSRSLNSSDG